MEIDKVFNNDVDGVADNLFSAVKNSVSEIKAMQQRKAAENVQLVIQALKKIESDLQDKFDGVTTVIEKRVSNIKDGRDGVDGRNGRDGKDGRPGRDGAPGARGPAGVPGTDGRDGEDGVSVTDARIDFDGSLIISLSSGREINVGEVVAPDLAEKIKVITNGGGTSQVVLDTLASLQAQITAISNLGVVNYVGTWNASTNSPTITSGSGDKGDYYVVSVAGSTNIDGQTLWGVGDWIIFNGTAWQRVDGGSTGNFTTVSASGNITTGGDIFTNPDFGIFFNGPSSFSTGIFSSSDGSQMRFYAGGIVDALRLTGTGFGVFNNSPAAALDVTGTARISSTVTLSGGTANGVAYLNGSKVLTTGSALTFDGTNFNVVRSAATDQYMSMYADGTGPTLKFFGGAAGKIAGIVADSASASMYFTNEGNKPFVYAINGSEQMRLTSTGLGIGTSSPGFKLDVGGQDGTNIALRSTGTSQARFRAYVNGAESGVIGFLNGGGQLFEVAGTEQMRLTSTGLGIGLTPNALFKLDVNGNARISSAGAQGLEVQPGAVTYLLAYNRTTSVYTPLDLSGEYLRFSTNNGSERMRITAAGDVGIGTSSPVYQTQIYGSGQTTAALTDAGNKGGSLLLNTPTVSAGDGGALLLGAGGSGAKPFAAIKGLLADGGGNTTGSIAFSTRNATGDTALTERMRLDSSGNLGLGVTPSANNIAKAFELQSGFNMFGYANLGYINANAYYNGGWLYKNTAAAGRYEVGDAHKWYTAPSGTAGNAISFTQAMTLDASGNLGVGTTSPTATLHVKGGNTNNLKVDNGGQQYTEVDWLNNGTIKAVAYWDNTNAQFLISAQAASSSLAFGTVNSERARITSGGYFKASNNGAYFGGTGSYHEFRNSVDEFTQRNTNTNATTPYGYYIQYTAAAPNGTGSQFLYCEDNVALRAEIRSNGGLANYSGNNTNLSDRREKTNFAPAKSYLETICAIPVQTFNYIDQSEDDHGLTLGVVAQDVQAVAPELVMESNWGSKDDPKMRLSIYQTDLQYALMKCIQELKAEVDSLKAQLKGA